MIYFLAFAIIAVILIAIMILINSLIIRKSPLDKVKNVFRLILSIILSLVAGGIGFFLTFALGEGLMGVLSEKITMLITFCGVSIFNFIVCLFIGRFYFKSIWFAWVFVNIIVWVVIIMNPEEFIDSWWGWTALVIFAFIGSIAGLLISRKAHIAKFGTNL